VAKRGKGGEGNVCKKKEAKEIKSEERVRPMNGQPMMAPNNPRPQDSSSKTDVTMVEEKNVPLPN